MAAWKLAFISTLSRNHIKMIMRKYKSHKLTRTKRMLRGNNREFALFKCGDCRWGFTYSGEQVLGRIITSCGCRFSLKSHLILCKEAYFRKNTMVHVDKNFPQVKLYHKRKQELGGGLICALSEFTDMDLLISQTSLYSQRQSGGKFLCPLSVSEDLSWNQTSSDVSWYIQRRSLWCARNIGISWLSYQGQANLRERNAICFRRVKWVKIELTKLRQLHPTKT